MPTDYYHAQIRRARITELLRSGDPKVHTAQQLTDMLNEEGHLISKKRVERDLQVLHATKYRPTSGGKSYYVLAGKNVDASAEVAVAEAEARRRVHMNGVRVSDLGGMVPVFVQTLDAAGSLTGQPFQNWKPHGTVAVLSGHEGFILYVEPEQVERVKLMLHQMMVGG